VEGEQKKNGMPVFCGSSEFNKTWSLFKRGTNKSKSMQKNDMQKINTYQFVKFLHNILTGSGSLGKPNLPSLPGCSKSMFSPASWMISNGWAAEFQKKT
jgi:hypothetical protein